MKKKEHAFNIYIFSTDTGYILPVSIDGGTWYPQACQFLKLPHHVHSFVYKNEKSIIERTMQYIKDRTMNVLMIDFHAVEKRNVN